MQSDHTEQLSIIINGLSKIQWNPKLPQYIKTKHSVGYSFDQIIPIYHLKLINLNLPLTTTAHVLPLCKNYIFAYYHDCIIVFHCEKLHLENGKKIILSKLECELLYFLMIHRNQIMTYNQIFRNVWSEEYVANSKPLSEAK